MYILDAMIPVANAIAATIGDNCSVAIHDFSRPLHSVYHVVNGHLLGQHKGDSLGFAMSDLMERNGDSIVNYFGQYNGHSIKATKTLIRDEEGKIIGCFCINIVIDDFLSAKKTLERLCMTLPLSAFQEEEKEAADEISEVCRTIINNAYYEYTGNIPVLSKQDKINLTRELDKKGVFKIKGSVEQLANLIGVSKFTIYGYLRPGKEEADE